MSASINTSESRVDTNPSSTENPSKPLDGKRSRDKEVVEAAVKLFHEQGYASTSVQDIAESLGMLKGSLYYYIDTKETLLKRIFETSHEHMLSETEQHRNSDQQAIDRFRSFVRSYALWYMNNIPRASLYEREWRHASAELREFMLEQRRHYFTAIRDLVAEVRRDADLPTQGASTITMFIASAVSSLPDSFRPEGSKTAEDIADLYVSYAELVALGAD